MTDEELTVEELTACSTFQAGVVGKLIEERDDLRAQLADSEATIFKTANALSAAHERELVLEAKLAEVEALHEDCTAQVDRHCDEKASYLRNADKWCSAAVEWAMGAETKLAEAEKANLDLWRRRDERLETVKGHWRKAQRQAENWKAAAKIFWRRWMMANDMHLNAVDRAEAAEARCRELEQQLKVTVGLG